MHHWIFGYGSLVWRPDFPFIEAHSALARGWARRFYQGSVDHRGVPGAPGRVVTLLPDARAQCWGRAFRVSPHTWDGVLERLDAREVGGYERVELHLELRPSPEAPQAGRRPVEVQGALTYVATERNAHFLGPAPLEAIASQVLSARGPSGHNTEYVLRLAEAVRAMGVQDEHLHSLEREVRRRLAGRSSGQS